MNKLWIIALETYKRNIKSPTFFVMILAPFMMVGFSLLGGLIGNKFGETTNIAVVAKDTTLREDFLKRVSLEVDEAIDTEDSAKKALENEEIDGFLVINSTEKQPEISGEFFGESSLSQTDELEIQQILTSMQLARVSDSLKLSAEDVQKLNQPSTFTTKTVSFDEGVMTDKADNKLAQTLGSVFISLAMYVIILMYAQVVATEVASEKGTRIMEIILSSTSASKHFYGKILGIFLVILTQVVIYIGLGLGAFFFTKETDFIKDMLSNVSIKELVGGLIGYNLLYLLLGVVIYTVLAALCGSLVSKSEDAGKAVAPVTYLTMIGFFLTIFLGMNDPQHILMKITSFIPFLSSFTMPLRIASQTVSVTEIVISLVILLLSMLILLKLSAKIYRSTALVYSDTGMWQSLKKSLSLMKSEQQ
ncbi:ABC transporter permease [Vagococcus xieshaowenii]|uniref:ABC transporter permease n=1 Tax=Vagococcus xieshaowenii TaxID=2562451 RepID=A0AAJ5EEB1_9ENTE|nr:ABC transporter permease [Vagococcus xieshaowenii]QCA27969.1 ABC transporter permease [Vagococcus xieshaowenii]TFZ41264.1 ABC transporter permease [Vagococcus xieshaowenii]